MKERGSDSSPPPPFAQLVAMLQLACLQHLGKIINPLTKKVEKDLNQARVSIDLLEMLKEKTKGNLSWEEEQLLDKVLFELHMDYVDEVDAEKKDKPAGEEQRGGMEKEGGESD